MYPVDPLYRLLPLLGYAMFGYGLAILDSTKHFQVSFKSVHHAHYSAFGLPFIPGVSTP